MVLEWWMIILTQVVISINKCLACGYQAHAFLHLAQSENVFSESEAQNISSLNTLSIVISQVLPHSPIKCMYCMYVVFSSPIVITLPYPLHSNTQKKQINLNLCAVHGKVPFVWGLKCTLSLLNLTKYLTKWTWQWYTRPFNALNNPGRTKRQHSNALCVPLVFFSCSVQRNKKKKEKIDFSVSRRYTSLILLFRAYMYLRG